MLAFHEIKTPICIFSTLGYVPLAWQKNQSNLLLFIPQEGGGREDQTFYH